MIQANARVAARAAWPVAAAVLPLLLAIAVLDVRTHPLDVPYDYRADASLNGMAVKATLDHGWPLSNPQLGAPGGQSLLDFPFYDNQSLLVMRLLSVGADDWPTVLNLFFLLTFPAVGLAAWASFRRIGLERATSLLLAVLYAVTPYHFLRGEQHLFLTSYAMVPMAGALVIDVLQGRPLLGGRGRSAFTVVAIVTTGCAVQYYPVFVAMLLVLAAAAAAVASRRVRAVVPGVVAAGLTVALFLLNLLPNILHRLVEGENTAVGHRTLLETMAFSLRLTDLLLPIRDHRVTALGARVQNATPELGGPMEMGSPALGVVASVGFVALLAVAVLALVARRRDLDDDAGLELRHLALPAVGAFLVATTGGGAAIVAFWFGSPLRAWNRLSIVIAFFALAAVGVLLQRLTLPRLAKGALLVVMAIVGVLDQTSPGFGPDRGPLLAAWRSDQAFVERIERELPEGAAVLQLPYLSFPENGQFRGMIDYEPLRAYLHADDLAFSYGAIRDRPGDWQEALAGAPAPVAAFAAAAAGFEGVWIDRRGYPGMDDALLESLADVTGEAILTSADGSFAFVALGDLSRRSGLAALRPAVLEPVTLSYGNGFLPREQDDRHLWNWTVGGADLVLRNPSGRARTVVVRTTIATLGPAGRLTIGAPGGVAVVQPVDLDGELVELRVRVPAGGTTIRIDTDVAPAASPDGRVLALRLVDLSVVEAGLYDAVADLGIALAGAVPVV